MAENQKYKCAKCGYTYDPEIGDPKHGIGPGTPFEDLPEDWKCPRCRKPKDQFIEKEEKKATIFMEEKALILEVMKKAGEPLNAGKIAELTGLDRKVVDKAMNVMKKDARLFLPYAANGSLPKNKRCRPPRYEVACSVK